MKKNILIGIAIAASLIAIGLVIFDGSVINCWDGHFDIPVAISRGGQELGTNDISCVRYSATGSASGVPIRRLCSLLEHAKTTRLNTPTGRD